MSVILQKIILTRGRGSSAVRLRSRRNECSYGGIHVLTELAKRDSDEEKADDGSDCLAAEY